MNQVHGRRGEHLLKLINSDSALGPHYAEMLPKCVLCVAVWFVIWILEYQDLVGFSAS